MRISTGKVGHYKLTTRHSAFGSFPWDGGNAINTKQLNLTKLVSTHVEGGPCASLVKRTDQSYPGIAIHYVESEHSLTIQLL